MVRLFLIRHGVTEWNRDRRYCGSRDIGLSREGRSQAKLLSDSFSAGRFDKIYCSDRKRATQTARILFKKAKIIPKRGLREIGFGVLEGLRHEEIIVKYSSAYEKWLNDPFVNNISRAEPMHGFKKRVESVLSKIIRLNSGKTVAVVCHGGVIGIFLNGILKNRGFWRCVPSPASITVVEHENGNLRLKKFNDTIHLKVNDE
jgi:broad specificity phosphatase PhoE